MTEPTTKAGRALLEELSESPLPGARYALDVVQRRLPAVEAEAVAFLAAQLAEMTALAGATPTVISGSVQPRTALEAQLEQEQAKTVALVEAVTVVLGADKSGMLASRARAGISPSAITPSVEVAVWHPSDWDQIVEVLSCSAN